MVERQSIRTGKHHVAEYSKINRLRDFIKPKSAIKNTPAERRVEKSLEPNRSRWAPYRIFRLFRTSGTCTPNPVKAPLMLLLGQGTYFNHGRGRGISLNHSLIRIKSQMMVAVIMKTKCQGRSGPSTTLSHPLHSDHIVEPRGPGCDRIYNIGILIGQLKVLL